MRRLMMAVGLMACCWSSVRSDPPASCEDGMRRAGYPQNVACYAHPGVSPAYTGYLVGGGSPCCRHGEPPYAWEGTWGWDYSGWCFSRRVFLSWFHGKFQGGDSAYKTFGPEPVKKHTEKIHERLEEHRQHREGGHAEQSERSEHSEGGGENAGHEAKKE